MIMLFFTVILDHLSLYVIMCVPNIVMYLLIIFMPMLHSEQLRQQAKSNP